MPVVVPKYPGSPPQISIVASGTSLSELQPSGSNAAAFCFFPRFLLFIVTSYAARELLDLWSRFALPLTHLTTSYFSQAALAILRITHRVLRRTWLHCSFQTWEGYLCHMAELMDKLFMALFAQQPVRLWDRTPTDGISQASVSLVPAEGLALPGMCMPLDYYMWLGVNICFDRLFYML